MPYSIPPLKTGNKHKQTIHATTKQSVFLIHIDLQIKNVAIKYDKEDAAKKIVVTKFILKNCVTHRGGINLALIP